MQGSIQDSYRYLSLVSDQGPGYVESFGNVGSRARFYQAIFYSQGAFQLSHHHPFALCRYYLIIAYYQARRLGV
jgi:hypothetical protein